MESFSDEVHRNRLMNIADIITPERIGQGVRSGSKKRVLELLSELIVSDLPTLAESEVFESLIARERLGSTAIGHGVAIPHGRMKSNGERSIGAFMQLEEGIDFDAADDQPVNLLFALLVPKDSTDEHLEILSKLAEMFSDEEFCDKLRAAKSKATLHDLLTHGDQSE